jgi:hypothetical protein
MKVRKDGKKGKEGETEEPKCHLTGGKTHTARLKGIWRHFIHIHDSRSYIAREKGLRVQGMYFKTEE